MEDSPIERTSEPRSITDRYYNVEFSINGSAYVYQFKIWDISPKGTYVFVKEDSDSFIESPKGL
jgi:hypothetical protein